jgi:hypothetical protein
MQESIVLLIAGSKHIFINKFVKKTLQEGQNSEEFVLKETPSPLP